jgi:dolichol kinase
MKLQPNEIKRKVVHMLFGVVAVILFSQGLINWVHIAYFAIISIALSLLSKKYRVPFIDWCLGQMERDENLKRFPGKGVIFYLIGIFLSMYFFRDYPDIVKASIMILAFGDTMGYICGVRFGRIEHPFSKKKCLEGMIAGIIAGFIGAVIFVAWQEALVAAIFAMAVEGLEMRIGIEKVDDNITIPIVASVTIWIVRFLF